MYDRTIGRFMESLQTFGGTDARGNDLSNRRGLFLASYDCLLNIPP